jgi:antitoxin (DNA-binding transcriptional repressor) of toxin-antitoxin stability system
MPVMNVSVEEVKSDPESVLHRVLEGEILVITERDQPIAEIRPIELCGGHDPSVWRKTLS